MVFTKSTIILGFAAAFVNAQIPGLSSSCQAALLQTTSNPDASTCLNIGGLLGVVTTPANTSFVPKIDAWISGICGVAPCQTATLNSLAANISSGCATDLQTGAATLNLTEALTTYYPTIRHILCLKDGNANQQFCETEQLTAIEKALGKPLDLNTIGGALTGTLTFNTTAVPKDVVCGACSQAAYSILAKEQPALIADPAVNASIKQECGDAFLTGGIPSSIIDAGASGTTSQAAKPGAAVALTAAGAMQWLGLASTSVVAGIAILFL